MSGGGGGGGEIGPPGATRAGGRPAVTRRGGAALLDALAGWALLRNAVASVVARRSVGGGADRLGAVTRALVRFLPGVLPAGRPWLGPFIPAPVAERVVREA